MPKVLDVPPLLDKSLITPSGEQVKITNATIRTGVQTSMGVISKALAIEVDFAGEKYSYLFSLDRETIGGSAGRLISKLCNVKDTDQLTDAVLRRMVGKVVTVRNRAGKLYWYP